MREDDKEGENDEQKGEWMKIKKGTRQGRGREEKGCEERREGRGREGQEINIEQLGIWFTQKSSGF